MIKEQDLLGYAAIAARNREAFLLNYSGYFGIFERLLNDLASVWARLGKERDTLGRSHAGLVPFINILVRHFTFGFQHIVSYQSFLAWLTFRPGLEAFLILGKFIDDPINAKVWNERNTNKSAYKKAFTGSALISKAIVKSNNFQKVLTRLNDDFMHPNPNFTYRDTTLREDETHILVEIQYFDVDTDVHRAHLLAYLNLLYEIFEESKNLLDKLLGSSEKFPPLKESFAEIEYSRAVELSKKSPIAKKVMEELGMWRFE